MRLVPKRSSASVQTSGSRSHRGPSLVSLNRRSIGRSRREDLWDATANALNPLPKTGARMCPAEGPPERAHQRRWNSHPTMSPVAKATPRLT
jgi:hypothetical protein